MFRRLFDPRVERYLIADEGEVIIDEVQRHWMAVIFPILRLFAAFILFFLAFATSGIGRWAVLLLSLGLAVQAGFRILEAHMDRFVITNIRVFRVNGVFNQHIATMPMTRILDVAVHKPLIGRLLGYGHFVFESAAQGQGLRDIRYVGRPNERDLTIQRAIQRSGVRGKLRPEGQEATPPPPPRPAETLVVRPVDEPTPTPVQETLEFREPLLPKPEAAEPLVVEIETRDEYERREEYEDFDTKETPVIRDGRGAVPTEVIVKNPHRWPRWPR